jgi:hypothetical protein
LVSHFEVAALSQRLDSRGTTFTALDANPLRFSQLANIFTDGLACQISVDRQQTQLKVCTAIIQSGRR